MSHETKSVLETTIPKNTRKEVAKLYKLSKTLTLSDIKKSEEWELLTTAFNSATKSRPLSNIDKTVFLMNKNEDVDLNTIKLSYLNQRNRLSTKLGRKEIVDMAIDYNAKYGGIPEVKHCEDGNNYITDNQKRSFALMLRGIDAYPVTLIRSTIAELADDFNSQFARKNTIKEVDKFRIQLNSKNANVSRRAWHMQNCLDDLKITLDETLGKPYLNKFGNSRKAMYDPIINKINPLKADSPSHPGFCNFRRAIEIYKSVWPAEFVTSPIDASFVRSLVCFISSTDPYITKEDDQQLTDVLRVAKNNPTIFKEVAPAGLDLPSKYSGSANNFNIHTDGLRYQNTIIHFSKVWNVAVNNTPALKIHVKLIDENTIENFSFNTARETSEKVTPSHRRKFIVVNADGEKFQ